ncbi:hypothetical protein [Dongshaea marina]|uniref:hypothetical protein n=1 Tax=Dongshaea marina TaxID=2047966 RepID=UPI000D3E386C|nr:hypothetical protein [Dongshaea marina]
MSTQAIRQIAFPWGPAKGLDSGLSLNELHQRIWEGELHITLGRPASHSSYPLSICRLTFRKVFSHRLLEEGELFIPYDEQMLENVVQLIAPSSYLAWFHLQTEGLHLGEPIHHYTVRTWDYRVDVLTSDPPKLEMLQE